MEEFQAAGKKEGDGGMHNFMDSMGLGMLGEQVRKLVMLLGIVLSANFAWLWAANYTFY